ncbi:Transposable element Tcb2 transposase [Araneus ventricosus]|uniref:Transposable element Tcb2 transposase n=1 Tax=Araneus ventricosus TaxID=182803 RepID=A0A4Y2GM18_ARAVE|nr:Transposable element Tcb2 transposase [Araneus ventricosus]
MGKTSDLDAFNRRQIVGARHMDHSISEIVRERGFSRSTVLRVYREYTDGGKKTSDRAICKGQLTLNERGVRRLSRIAREHREWTREDWKRVAWSDESRFRLFRADGKLRIWRQVHEAMDPACQVGTVQGHGGSIMVWGVFSWQFLVLVPTSLNAIRYVELLGDHLHPLMLYCHPHGNGVFQQDNCTSHRSRLDEHSSDFFVINWPPRSPDLNPIEHV